MAVVVVGLLHPWRIGRVLVRVRVAHDDILNFRRRREIAVSRADVLGRYQQRNVILCVETSRLCPAVVGRFEITLRIWTRRPIQLRRPEFRRRPNDKRLVKVSREIDAALQKF